LPDSSNRLILATRHGSTFSAAVLRAAWRASAISVQVSAGFFSAPVFPGHPLDMAAKDLPAVSDLSDDLYAQQSWRRRHFFGRRSIATQ